MILFTVTSLGAVLSGGVFEPVIVKELDLGPMTFVGIVAQVGSTGVTPVFPLAPWTIGVTSDGTLTSTGIGVVASALGTLVLLLDKLLD